MLVSDEKVIKGEKVEEVGGQEKVEGDEGGKSSLIVSRRFFGQVLFLSAGGATALASFTSRRFEVFLNQ